jgi:hypothetical protein
MSTDPAPSDAEALPRRRSMIVLIVTVVVTVALGGLTAVGQGELPAALGPLANSTGSWSLVAFAMAFATRSMCSAAVCGAVSLAGLLAGYVLADTARGLSSGTALILFWGAAAVVAGPFLGLAGHSVRHRHDLPAALGAGLMSGILVGEGVYGLWYVSGTTPTPYWWASVAAGLLLLAACILTRLRRARTAAAAVVTGAVIAATFVPVYAFGGTVMGHV